MRDRTVAEYISWSPEADQMHTWKSHLVEIKTRSGKTDAKVNLSCFRHFDNSEYNFSIKLPVVTENYCDLLPREYCSRLLTAIDKHRVNMVTKHASSHLGNPCLKNCTTKQFVVRLKLPINPIRTSWSLDQGMWWRVTLWTSDWVTARL